LNRNLIQKPKFCFVIYSQKIFSTFKKRNIIVSKTKTSIQEQKISETKKFVSKKKCLEIKIW